MDVSLELNNLNCQRENHGNSDIIGFCIDEKCNEINKFACSECFFDIHSQHKVVKIKELNRFIQGQYREYKKTLEEDKEKFDIYKKNELMNKEKIQQLKKDMIEQIEKKFDIFLENLSKKYLNLNGRNLQNFQNLKEYEEFFVGNAAPIQKIDLNKLSEICTNIYKDTKDCPTATSSSSSSLSSSKMGSSSEYLKPLRTKDGNEEKKLLKINKTMDEINKEIDDYISYQKLRFDNYLNSQFLKKQSPFEWCRKTYGSHNFYYQLTKNNWKGIKASANGTMTVLRAKEKLLDNYKYKIKFLIGLTNYGDFDLGIGTDKTGDSCWLRTRESICISNIGILNLDINYDNSKCLKDKSIVEFEINTFEKKKTFKIKFNDELVFDLDYQLKDVYIMAAIRNTENYIEVLEYDASPL
jgi:hypothetical protein